MKSPREVTLNFRLSAARYPTLRALLEKHTGLRSELQTLVSEFALAAIKYELRTYTANVLSKATRIRCAALQRER